MPELVLIARKTASSWGSARAGGRRSDAGGAYYNKPSQEGLYRHFQAVASGLIPVMLYNVPSRTSCNLEAETVGRLAKMEHIVAIKENGEAWIRYQK